MAVDLHLRTAVEQYRKDYEALDHFNALTRIRDAFLTNQPVEFAIIKFIISGVDAFRNDLNNLWQTVGVVSAFIGAISVTVLLAAPDRAAAFEHVDDFPSSSVSVNITQAYYAAWAMTSFCEIAAVLVVTISSVHLGLMLKEDEMIWFILHWSFATIMLPQILLTIGCFTLYVGCVLGAFLVGSNATGGIVICLSVLVLLVVLTFWFTMLYYNKSKEAEATERVKKDFLALFESRVAAINQKEYAKDV